MLKSIQAYQAFNAWLRQAQVPGLAYTNCRYYPSCSEYATLAVQRHGVGRGLFKSLVRILRCNPWSKGGVDYP
ncbi:MAG TPA: membrane protein insertion efficiency factor YidD [Candidatus Paceibacterota bacterium]|nr:membrane protein insertion efficiency factor YidD [Candidatus Paceibacterota bacterium]